MRPACCIASRTDHHTSLKLNLIATSALFLATAIMEITGCFLPYLWLKGKAGPWVLLPAAIALAAFVWLLSLHPTASGRVRPRLRSLWWCLRGHCHRLAVARGWHSTECL